MAHNSLESLERKIMSCTKCPRLVAWRESIAKIKKTAYKEWDYWGKPVPGFGDPNARVLIVGLAPGAHGSNRTGRMFTGDSSGNFLYPALYRAGFASQPTSANIGDGLVLQKIFITAVCRCAPPENRPDRGEINNCLPFLIQEMKLLTKLSGIVALGKIAFDAIISILEVQTNRRISVSFKHGALIRFGMPLSWVLASYHPSRQNTRDGEVDTIDV